MSHLYTQAIYGVKNLLAVCLKGTSKYSSILHLILDKG
jgi:hypothetical protein